jgi:hypothetical protein
VRPTVLVGIDRSGGVEAPSSGAAAGDRSSDSACGCRKIRLDGVCRFAKVLLTAGHSFWRQRAASRDRQQGKDAVQPPSMPPPAARRRADCVGSSPRPTHQTAGSMESAMSPQVREEVEARLGRRRRDRALRHVDDDRQPCMQNVCRPDATRWIRRYRVDVPAWKPAGHRLARHEAPRAGRPEAVWSSGFTGPVGSRSAVGKPTCARPGRRYAWRSDRNGTGSRQRHRSVPQEEDVPSPDPRNARTSQHEPTPRMMAHQLKGTP